MSKSVSDVAKALAGKPKTQAQKITYLMNEVDELNKRQNQLEDLLLRLVDKK